LIDSAQGAGVPGANRSLGKRWVAVPRANVDHPVEVGVDVMSGSIVAMFLLGSPFQVCYALHKENARALSHALLAASENVAATINRPLN
jgi:hypothetical protein